MKFAGTVHERAIRSLTTPRYVLVDHVDCTANGRQAYGMGFDLLLHDLDIGD